MVCPIRFLTRREAVAQIAGAGRVESVPRTAFAQMELRNKRITRTQSRHRFAVGQINPRCWPSRRRLELSPCPDLSTFANSSWTAASRVATVDPAGRCRSGKRGVAVVQRVRRWFADQRWKRRWDVGCGPASGSGLLTTASIGVADEPVGDEGMSTVEYAVGTVVAAAFAAVLYKIVTGDSVVAGLTSLVNSALHTSM